MCGFQEKDDTTAAEDGAVAAEATNVAGELAEQIGEAAGIEVTAEDINDVIGVLGEALTLELDPSDPETYVLRNSATGGLGFDFTQPRLMFQDSEPTVTFTQYEGESGYVTIVHINHAVEQAATKLEDAGYPHGLPYNETQLRGLALAASRAADELAAANANGGGAENGGVTDEAVESVTA